MTVAPTPPAELRAPSPTPGSLHRPCALPPQHGLPGADWQHSHSLKPSRAAGLNSHSRNSQIAACLLSRCRHALGSSQVAGEPRPLPLGWVQMVPGLWSAPSPLRRHSLPSPELFPNPRTRLAASDFPGQESRTLTPWGQVPPGDTRSDWLVPSQHYRLCPLPPKPMEKGGLEDGEGAVKHQSDRVLCKVALASKQGDSSSRNKCVTSLSEALQLWQPWIWEGPIPD